MTDRSRYSGIATLNHWITALLITAMLVLGFVMAASPERAIKHYVEELHAALGFFVLLFVLWRVGFRLYEGFPASVARNRFEHLLTRAVHWGLLLAMLVLVFSGPMYLFTEGEGVEVFGWFTFYIPLESLSGIHESVETVHKIMGLYALPILLGVHLVGAAVHLLRDRRETPADM